MSNLKQNEPCPANVPAVAPEKLPIKLIDLYTELNVAANINNLNILLNAEPPEKWIKRHPFVKWDNPDTGQSEQLPYIPIERVEYLLTTIFLRHEVVIKSITQVANSVVVVVRLKCLDPITGKWWKHDGIGAAPLKTQAGKGAIDWQFIKDSAVQTGAPAAESYAIKDAAEKFGKLFGRDISRKTSINYEAALGKKFNEPLNS